MKKRRVLILFVLPVLLVGGMGLWLRAQQQQFARNRQLITTLLGKDATKQKQALALVNEGADPNTPYAPPPVPTLRLLFNQLLHRRKSPVNNSDTAFIMACRLEYDAITDPVGTENSWRENRPLLQAMLAHGANIHARTMYNRTALYEAVYADRLHTVEWLLQHGADVNAQNERDQTPLMVAAWNDTSNTAHLLLLHGANPNAQDKAGDTALRYALDSPAAKSMIAELLAHGANPTLSDKIGYIPLQYAQHKNRPDIVALLKHSGK